jgi:hypothetical protein
MLDQADALNDDWAAELLSDVEIGQLMWIIRHSELMDTVWRRAEPLRRQLGASSRVTNAAHD